MEQVRDLPAPALRELAEGTLPAVSQKVVAGAPQMSSVQTCSDAVADPTLHQPGELAGCAADLAAGPRSPLDQQHRRPRPGALDRLGDRLLGGADERRGGDQAPFGDRAPVQPAGPVTLSVVSGGNQTGLGGQQLEAFMALEETEIAGPRRQLRKSG